MSFPGRLEHTHTHARTHAPSQMLSHRYTYVRTEHLSRLADSDYKPREYLPLVASRSYQERHAIRPNLLISGLPSPWQQSAVTTPHPAPPAHLIHPFTPTAQMWLVRYYLGPHTWSAGRQEPAVSSGEAQ